MFYEGDLSSGISTALQQQKLVLCFVREDGNEESDTWENIWLHQEDENGEPFGERLAHKAVLLKIEHGSQEAGFLGAFCTIDSSPMIVVIDKGQVLEKIEKGISEDEWRERISNICRLNGDYQAATPSAPASETPAVPQPSQSEPATHPPPQQQSLDNLFPNRAQQHEASAAAHREAEAAAIKARQDARKKEAEDAYAAHKGKGKASEIAEETENQKARDAWIYQQKQRKDEAKRERQRILNQIEADKQERKVRSQMAKQSSTEASENAQSSPLPESRLAGQRRSAGAGGMCSIQVRLFDGSSIRNRFSTRCGRALHLPTDHGPAAQQEHRMPVSGYTEAYSSSGGTGVFGMLAGAWNSLPNVSYFLPSFSRLYMGGTSDPQETSNVQGASMAGAETEPRDEAQGQASKVRVKTLADQRAEAARKDRQAEFYNGRHSLKWTIETRPFLDMFSLSTRSTLSPVEGSASIVRTHNICSYMSNTFPGFIIPRGSSAALIFFMTPIVSKPSSLTSEAFFPRPMPCSPVHVPSISNARSTMRVTQSSTFLRSSGSPF
ncbi:hypothetical protein KC333_g89 [Hortaea werneckii]|nr:hypothetical protein KC333_g89 [Hortaea werneckii]